VISQILVYYALFGIDWCLDKTNYMSWRDGLGRGLKGLNVMELGNNTQISIFKEFSHVV
jgi:hypothetical protein